MGSHLRRAARGADRLVPLQRPLAGDAHAGPDANREHRDEDAERDEEDGVPVLRGDEPLESDREEEDAGDLHDHDAALDPRQILDRLDLLLVREPRLLAGLEDWCGGAGLGPLRPPPRAPRALLAPGGREPGRGMGRAAAPPLREPRASPEGLRRQAEGREPVPWSTRPDRPSPRTRISSPS